MKQILLVISIFIAAGAAGMGIANKKVTVEMARSRWLKFYSYLLITSLVLIAIYAGFFSYMATLIIAAGYYELMRASPGMNILLAVLVYSVIAAGFLFVAFSTSVQFQFFLYFQVLSFDAFCQITGQLWGRTPLATAISPTKTVEGLAGGIIVCILSSLLSMSLLGIQMILALILGLITAAASLAGDLLASWYKRRIGTKDYSRLLPGQGGFLDRFDSLLLAAFCYALLFWMKIEFMESFFK